MCIQEKFKMCKFPVKASEQKYDISIQKLCNLIAFVIGFPKSYKLLKIQ